MLLRNSSALVFCVRSVPPGANAGEQWLTVWGRKSHSGIFHMLPLGRRVEDKIQHLIDQHMESLGQAKCPPELGWQAAHSLFRGFEAFPLEHLLGSSLGEEWSTLKGWIRGMAQPISSRPNWYLTVSLLALPLGRSKGRGISPLPDARRRNHDTCGTFGEVL